MATLNCRRANSLPAPTELAKDAVKRTGTMQTDGEVTMATSPPLADSGGFPSAANFSPVFDLELGGTCASTPQGRCEQGPSRRSTPQHLSSAGIPMAPHPQPVAEVSAAATLQCTANNGPAPAVSAGGLDRSASDLQVLMSRRAGGPAAAAHSIDLLTPAGKRLAELCKPASELELQLCQRLRAFRASRISKCPLPAHLAGCRTLPAARGGGTEQSSSSPGPSFDPSPLSSTAAAAHQGPPMPSAASAALGGVTSVGAAAGEYQYPSGGASPGRSPSEIEALALELRTEGFLVHVLDGTRLSKDARSCLRTLKHHFLVCLGRAAAAASASSQQQQQQPGLVQRVADEAEVLSEPLVVEVRFREQFLIASPTRAYELMLLALPVVFVGPLARLDAVVELMAAQVAAVFRGARRPLPPWRTKAAMLSKWAPAQVGELGRYMALQQQPGVAAPGAAGVERQQPHQQQHQPQQLQRAKVQASGDQLWVAGFSDTTHAHVAAIAPQELHSAALRLWPSALGTAPDHTAAAACLESAVLAPGKVGLGRSQCSAPLPTARLHSACGGGPAHGDSTACDISSNYGGADVVQPEPFLAEPPGLSLGGCGRKDGGEHPGELSFPILPEVSPLLTAERLAFGDAGSTRDQQGCQQQQQRQGSQEGERVLRMAGDVVEAGTQQVKTAVVPFIRSLGGPIMLSPFARASVPERYECEEDDRVSFDSSSLHPLPWSAQLLTVDGVDVSSSCNSHGEAAPEFTFKHAVLNLHLESDVYDTPAAGGPGRGPVAPVLTPPQGASLTVPSAAVHVTAAAVPCKPGCSRLAGCFTAAAAAAAPEPLACDQWGEPSGVLGRLGGGSSSPAVVASGRPATQQHMGQPNVHAAVNGDDSSSSCGLHLPRTETLRITRRSSSDLHRAAEKFKQATSLLATALRLAKGGGGSSRDGITAAPAVVAAPGPSSVNHHQQQQQQKQHNGPAPDCRHALTSGGGASNSIMATAEIGAGAGACSLKVAAAAGGVGAGKTPALQQLPCSGCTLVALPGGVMTQPSVNEPTWARIRTIKWN